MTRSMIYLITIFALWLYFKYGTFEASSQTTGGVGYGLGGSGNGGGAGRR